MVASPLRIHGQVWEHPDGSLDVVDQQGKFDVHLRWLLGFSKASQPCGCFLCDLIVVVVLFGSVIC